MLLQIQVNTQDLNSLGLDEQNLGNFKRTWSASLQKHHPSLLPAPWTAVFVGYWSADVFIFLLLLCLEIDHKVKPSEPYLLAYMNNFFSTLLVVPVRVLLLLFSVSLISRCSHVTWLFFFPRIHLTKVRCILCAECWMLCRNTLGSWTVVQRWVYIWTPFAFSLPWVRLVLCSSNSR